MFFLFSFHVFSLFIFNATFPCFSLPLQSTSSCSRCPPVSNAHNIPSPDAMKKLHPAACCTFRRKLRVLQLFQLNVLVPPACWLRSRSVCDLTDRQSSQECSPRAKNTAPSLRTGQQVQLEAVDSSAVLSVRSQDGAPPLRRSGAPLRRSSNSTD